MTGRVTAEVCATEIRRAKQPDQCVTGDDEDSQNSTTNLVSFVRQLFLLLIFVSLWLEEFSCGSACREELNDFLS